jgi:hypothetical protein
MGRMAKWLWNTYVTDKALLRRYLVRSRIIAQTGRDPWCSLGFTVCTVHFDCDSIKLTHSKQP